MHNNIRYATVATVVLQYSSYSIHTWLTCTIYYSIYINIYIHVVATVCMHTVQYFLTNYMSGRTTVESWSFARYCSIVHMCTRTKYLDLIMIFSKYSMHTEIQIGFKCLHTNNDPTHAGVISVRIVARVIFRISAIGISTSAVDSNASLGPCS